MERDEEFYQSLDEGIREDVRKVHKLGYDTSDSGDGSSELECAINFPNIHVVVGKDKIVRASEDIFSYFPEWSIQAHYSPNDRVSGVLMIDYSCPIKTLDDVSKAMWEDSQKYG